MALSNCSSLSALLQEAEASHVTIRQAVWALLTDPHSSSAAALWSVLITCTIAVAIMTFIMDTDPALYSSKGQDEPIGITVIDITTTAIFTLEIALTLWSTPTWRNLVKMTFLVDVAVVLPSWVGLASGNTPGASFAVLRVFRLLRVLRLFRVSRTSTYLLITAVQRSTQMLIMLVMLLMIVVTVLAVIIHVIERGVWDPVRREWRREIAWRCLYDVTVLPDGTQLAASGALFLPAPPTCNLEPSVSDTERTWACTVPIESGRDCVAADWDQSPFESIPKGIWWALVTISVVGALHTVTGGPA